MCLRLGFLLVLLLSPHPRAVGQRSVFRPNEPPVLPVATSDRPEDSDAPRADGYRGIWFTLGQFSEHGDKYSGGLGTYTANHVPLAVYSPKANKTFFTYGGTTPGQRHLLIMASYYDHQTGQVPRPVVVHDKQGVNDPHDNAALNLDEHGHVWIFVSGRGRNRPGFKYRSREPFSVAAFERVAEEEMTYPQPWHLPGRGWLHLFTKYTKGRELYYETSPDGRAWSPDRQLAGFGGHYQVSGQRDGRIGTFFNYHPGGNVDKRCNLYYVQTDDGGATWTTVEGRPVELPLREVNNPALVLESESAGVLTYTCDLNFDDAGHPLLLYVTSRGHQPGPQNDPRDFRLTRWDGRAWQTRVVAPTDHNYDMGSLYVARDRWSVIAPTLPGPQPYASGGELCLWASTDHGRTWVRERQITRDSPRNHNYARRPMNARDPFIALWADGDPGQFSESHLYFSDASGGRVGRLPYHMDGEWARPNPEPRSRGREPAPQSSVKAGTLRRRTSAATAPRFMATGQVQGQQDASPDASVAVPAGVMVVSGPIWERHVIDQTSSGADGVKLGDLDGDGRLDLVTGWEEGGEVRAYLRPARADVRKPWPRVTVGKVNDPEDAIFADLDGDGRLDVVSCTEGSTRTVFWHRLRGELDAVLEAERWSTTAFPATRGAQMWMQAIALNLDGRHGPDLVIASKGPGATLGWLEGPPRPEDVGAWRFHPLREVGWIMSLISQDLDGDGDADVVFTDRKGGRSGVFWIENPGAAANRKHTPWPEHAIGALGREVMFADVAEVNRDGRPEVVVAVKPAEVLILSNQEDGGWRGEVVRLDHARLGGAKAVKVADVNRDGWPDLLFSCENARGDLEGVIWLEQQRPGPWRQHPLGGPAGTKFDLLEILDLDEDGDLDLITCEEADGLGLVWYENPA